MQIKLQLRLASLWLRLIYFFMCWAKRGSPMYFYELSAPLISQGFY